MTAFSATQDGRVVLPGNAPLQWARDFLTHNRHGALPTLAFWRGAWWTWDGCWQECGAPAVRSLAYEFLDMAMVESKEGVVSPFCPTRSKVDDLLDAARGLVIVSDAIDPFSWRDEGPDPRFLLPLKNGLLDIRRDILIPPSPAFMATAVADWTYECRRDAPVRWLQFLDSLWPDDDGEVALLCEVMGLLLSGETSFQKILMLIGPPRSGKGTILRILHHLVGPDLAVSMTTAAFAREFGLASTIHKRLAIVPDLRFANQVDKGALLERLLQISGGDHAQIARKFRDDWTGTPTARLVAAANELPRIPDDSAALANRYVPVVMKRSFLGNEETGLFNDLVGEAEQIARWSMFGLRRLLDRGHFQLPASSTRLIDAATEVGSPVRAFVVECCTVAQDAEEETEILWAAWRGWCERNGEKPGSQAVFGKRLRSAYPDVERARARGSRIESRGYVYRGIAAVSG